jgi:hypothetical protein
LGVYHLTPEAIRDRTPEEVERLRLAAESEQAGRYRVVYETLGIQVTANKDKSIVVAGTFDLETTSLPARKRAKDEDPGEYPLPETMTDAEARSHELHRRRRGECLFARWGRGIVALPDSETYLLLLAIRCNDNEKVKTCCRFETPCRRRSRQAGGAARRIRTPPNRRRRNFALSLPGSRSSPFLNPLDAIVIYK